MSRPSSARTEAELYEHFEIERELASRLRAASSSAERQRLYGQVYGERSHRIALHPLVLQANDPRARALAVAPQVRLLTPFLASDAIFLEVGAGDGAVTRAVAPLVASATGLDVTDALFCESGTTAGFELRTFDGLDLAVPECSVDVVYSHDVVEHLHPEDMLAQATAIRAALRPGGVYVCVTPNRLSGPHDISRHFSDTPEGFHLCEYTAGELAHRLRAAGFASVTALLSRGGRHLTPQFPVDPIGHLEKQLERLPLGLRRVVCRGLHAVKLVAAR